MHVDRLPRARGHADDLARPDGHERLAADAARCRLGRARHHGRRHAARQRRRATDDGAAGVAGRRGYRLDTAGHRADRRPQRAQHVHQGQCAGARHHREYELFPVPPLRRAQRYLLAWRRPPRGGAARHRFPGGGAARSRDPRNCRRGLPDHRVAAGFALRADLPRHRRQDLGKGLGRIHRPPRAAPHRRRVARARHHRFSGGSGIHSLRVDGRDKEGLSRQNGGMDLPRPLPARVVPPPLPRLIAARLPVFYGWVVLTCLCCAGFARQGPAVATLSIFVEPLTRGFGLSRTALSGAVSLGGVLAAISAPLIGPLLDRRGSRLVLCAAVLVNGVALLLLSATGSLLHFYLLFCLARMNWAGPFDLGIYGALSNWFVRRRTFATSIATLAQQAGLVAMPLVAQIAILHQGWRAGWLAIGAVTLVIGFVPVWLLLVRRPEGLGLAPDGFRDNADHRAADDRLLAGEPAFSRREALHTRAFSLGVVCTALVVPVLSGVRA